MFNFDATTVEPSGDYDLLPTGDYTAIIKAAEVKDTKAGTGRYINFQLEIVSGQHAGRVVFDLVNFENPNPVAQDIGQKTLSAICHATKVMQLNNPEQLCNIPMSIKLGIKKDAEYGDKNTIKSYKAASSTPDVSKTTTTETGDGKPPWG